ncbi:retrovirus-related pol polyprotein from transposon TNT 1-94 [Tanacetum coccineum]
MFDPLAYLASTNSPPYATQTTTPPPPQYGPLTSSTPQQVPQSSNDAMLATMNQIVNLLRGTQKLRAVDGQTLGRKMLLMEAKVNGTILDAVMPKHSLLMLDCYQLDNEVHDVPTESQSNPWNLKQAKLSQPTLYDGHALLNPTHTSVKVHDSEDSLVHAEVSRTKMSKRLGTIKPINYAELNALYSHFVPQKELSREQVYWLPAEELATQKSNPPKPVTPFVRTRPAKSQISTCLQGLNSLIPAFSHVIHQRTDPCRYPSGSGEFKPVKAMFTEQIIPFYEKVKQLVQKLNENIVTEVTEYMRIFDELDTEYERCVLANKNLKIERKNLLIQNDCLIANCLEKDICSIGTLNVRRTWLEEILKKQQMLHESEKCCAFIEKNHVNLQVKFQKYKECLQNQRVCDNSNSTASNEIFEINKLKDQLQGKDDTIRNLQTQINITRMLNVGSTVGSFDKQALETELTQLKDALTLHLGAGAGTIFLHCPLPISRSSSEQKEASYMTGPLFLNAVMELNLTSLVQDIFLVSRSSNDHQLQHYATWAVLFIKHYIWSSDRSNEDRESNSSSQSVPDD